MSATPSVCPRCSREFDCGIGSGACWCAEVTTNGTTRAALAGFYDGCLCRECLQSMEDDRPQAPTVRAFLRSQLEAKRRARRD
jgi:cysteine-rich CWC protein